ncbi:MAG: hypothetical protein AAF587_38455 [Bacteroidota bacterium]
MPFHHTFSLKQHTPIIHFQYGEEGASLRPTELKPKLDAYIFEQLSDDIPMSWRVGKQKAEHPALDYKLRIMLTGKKTYRMITQRDNIPMFFGNMGNDYSQKPKALVRTEKPVEVQILCMNPDLMETVMAAFPGFIARTNFGTRQNKGFGSFSLWDEKKETLYDLSEVLPKTPYLSVRTTDLNAILTVINYYFQRLKSGINYRNHYEKGFLRQYLDKHASYVWEKRWLKETFVGGLSPDSRTEYFARALLGMPGSFSFKPNRNGNRPPYPQNTTDITVEGKTKGDKEIARIKSPITFKPIIYDRECRIYVVSREFNEEEKKQLDKQLFEFSHAQTKASLGLPPKEQFFSLSDVIRKYHEHLGNRFEARDFSGRVRQTVTIHTPQNA